MCVHSRRVEWVNYLLKLEYAILGSCRREVVYIQVAVNKWHKSCANVHDVWWELIIYWKLSVQNGVILIAKDGCRSWSKELV